MEDIFQNGNSAKRANDNVTAIEIRKEVSINYCHIERHVCFMLEVLKPKSINYNVTIFVKFLSSVYWKVL